MPPPELEPLFGRGERVQLPMVAEQRRSSRTVLGWLVVVLILVGIGVGAVWERDQIVGLWPPAARLYGLIGVPVVQPGTGLELRKVTPTREVDAEVAAWRERRTARIEAQRAARAAAQPEPARRRWWRRSR